ncbi:hypothetical protein [Mycetocola zhadangensis]|uniref:Uncharacterized protein n=1 Tax=Mycetocola zhadangensis TaxID=1164595 RepID=A0A3L7J199_9MICO|nr:hypothetical protein [Mycetocola zhadangensis]RLQ84283.1 hypothetical protein D9V28_08755 [Mycetocola zhadangensis]GGE94418.1 hypothetical protein GCM10011313_16720 [Mycetocola zhadangensis]
MAVVLGDPPDPPINLSWGDPSKKNESLSRTYESLTDLGIDLEFEREGEWAGFAPAPVFTDRVGRRFRILVMSLEVVLCVEVPADYEPAQLRLRRVWVSGEEIVIESLHSVDHRALSSESRTAIPIETIELADETITASEDTDKEGSSVLSWPVFDEDWMNSVDPAPPFIITLGSLGTWLSQILRNRFRRLSPPESPE